MLTVRRINVGDSDEARFIARRLLDASLAPTAFRRPGVPYVQRASAMWLGSDEALGALGLRRGTSVSTGIAAWALQGRHTATGVPVVAAREATAFDLRFAVPNSVSWVWSQAAEDWRARLEQATIEAAHAAFSYLVQTRPVVGNREPAGGFAAFMVLHGTVSRSPGPPPPLLHVHCALVGVTDAGGVLCPADQEALTEETVARECGAYGRATLARELERQGLRVQARTGPGGRYFEIDGVPPGLAGHEMFAGADCGGPVQEDLYARRYA